MNALISILSTVFGVFLNKPKDTPATNADVKIGRVEHASSMIVLVCAIALFFYWIPQFILADIFWIKHCIQQNQLVAFPINADELFKLIYSLCGLGFTGVLHKIIKRFK